MNQDSGKKGRKSDYSKAEHPDLIQSAKDYLDTHDFSLQKLLNEPKFLPLKDSKDIKTFILKYIWNKAKTQNSKHKSKEGEILLQNEQEATKESAISDLGESIHLLKDKSQLNSNMRPLISTNSGAKVHQEIVSNYLIEYMSVKPLGRYSFIENIFNRNTQGLLDFLLHLKTTCEKSFSEGMFPLIHELITNSQVSIKIKTRLFVSSLPFYQREQIAIDEVLLQSAMSLLAKNPSTEQTLGLANYVFYNEVEGFCKFEAELIKLNQNNIGIIQMMGLTFNQFSIDKQVIRLIPNTLLCLNKPFIQILKNKQGLRLIQNINPNCVGDFVSICALANSPNIDSLTSFIDTIQEVFIEDWDYLDQDDYSLCLSLLQNELKQRNPYWVHNLGQMKHLCKGLSILSKEKGILGRPDIVQSCIEGDFSLLENLLQIPREAEDLNGDLIKKMITLFSKQNQANVKVQEFCRMPIATIIDQDSLLLDISTHLKFKFLKHQVMCMNFLLGSKAKTQFISFGIGNGKTLLCSTLAIILSIRMKLPVFIVGKNDHLVLRDEKTYENLCSSLQVDVNVNSFAKTPGVYYISQKKIEDLNQKPDFMSIISKSICIIDEVDWVLLDGSVQSMIKSIEFFKNPQRLIGFTGSTLTTKEITCFETCFSEKPIIFPALKNLKADKKVHLEDELVTSNIISYTDRLKQLVFAQIKLTPVIIVASNQYIPIESALKKCSNLTLQSLRHQPPTKVDGILEMRFTLKDKEGNYGVYLLNELLGRGTDLKSTNDIELNGGNYLIIADIFSKRSTEQIIGRIGRLDKKGQWRQLIYSQGCKESVEVLIQLTQNNQENEIHLKFSKLISTFKEGKGDLSFFGSESQLDQVQSNREQSSFFSDSDEQLDPDDFLKLPETNKEEEKDKCCYPLVENTHQELGVNKNLEEEKEPFKKSGPLPALLLEDSLNAPSQISVSGAADVGVQHNQTPIQTSMTIRPRRSTVKEICFWTKDKPDEMQKQWDDSDDESVKKRNIKRGEKQKQVLQKLKGSSLLENTSPKVEKEKEKKDSGQIPHHELGEEDDKEMSEE